MVPRTSASGFLCLVLGLACLHVSCIYICVGIWDCFSVLSHIPAFVGRTLYTCICLWVFACICTWQVDSPVPLHRLFLGFWMRMLLHVSVHCWESVTTKWLKTALKCLESQERNLMLENIVGQQLLENILGSYSFWLTSDFLPDKVHSVFPGPLLAPSTTTRPPRIPS